MIHSTNARHAGQVSVSSGGNVIAASSTAASTQARVSARLMSSHRVSGSSVTLRNSATMSRDRLGYDEGVLDQGAEVMVDVD